MKIGTSQTSAQPSRLPTLGVDLQRSFIDGSQRVAFCLPGEAYTLIRRYQGAPQVIEGLTDIFSRRKQNFPKNNPCNLSLLILAPEIAIVYFEHSCMLTPQSFDGYWRAVQDSPAATPELAAKHARKIVAADKIFSEACPEAPFPQRYLEHIFIIKEHSRQLRADLLLLVGENGYPKQLTPEGLKQYYEQGHRFICHLEHFAPFQSPKAAHHTMTSAELRFREKMALQDLPAEQLTSMLRRYRATDDSLKPYLTELLELCIQYNASLTGLDTVLKLATDSRFSLDDVTAIVTSLPHYRRSVVEAINVLARVVHSCPDALSLAAPYFETLKAESVDLTLLRAAGTTAIAPHFHKSPAELKTEFLRQAVLPAEEISLDRLEHALHVVELSRHFDHQWGQLGIDKTRKEAASILSHGPVTAKQNAQFLSLANHFYQQFYRYHANETQMVAIALIAMQDQLLGPEWQGQYAQVLTGEGKSLIFAYLAAYRALQGNTVDIITANNYLAQRDANEQGAFYASFGLRAAFYDFMLEKDPQAIPRSPILYTTNRSLAFAHLAGVLCGKNVLEQRRFGDALVDEADALFIESSAESCRVSSLFKTPFTPAVIMQLQTCLRTLGVQERHQITPELIADLRRVVPEIRQVEDLSIALYATSIVVAPQVRLNYEYAIHQNSIKIIDIHNTGRLQETIWMHGLSQIVAMRHSLPPPIDSYSSAEISYTSLLRRYKRLNCLSGTMGSLVERQEIAELYRLGGMNVPPHLPSRLVDYKLVVAENEHDHNKLLASRAMAFTKGEALRAVLIVSSSVERARALHTILKKYGLRPQLYTDLINEGSDGLQVSESALISRVGLPGSITCTTLVGGRGNNFKLHPKVALAGGLHIILDEVPLNDRCEAQARGRAGRQGTPGSGEILACWTTDSFINHLPPAVRTVLKEILDEWGGRSLQMGNALSYARHCNDLCQSLTRRSLLAKDEVLQSALTRYAEVLQKLRAELVGCNHQFQAKPYLAGQVAAAWLEKSWVLRFDRLSTFVHYSSIFDNEAAYLAARHRPSTAVESMLMKGYERLFNTEYRGTDELDPFLLRVNNLTEFYRGHLAWREYTERLPAKSDLQLQVDAIFNDLSAIAQSAVSTFLQLSWAATKAKIKLLRLGKISIEP